MSAVANPPTHYTVDEFLALPDHEDYELVDGKLVEIEVSNLAAVVAGEALTRLNIFCKAAKLGPVFPSDAYFQCLPGRPRNARKPDVSFIRKERLPEHWLADRYFTIAPDLAIEVLSPNDLVFKVDRKTREYLDAGVKLIWVINPEQRLVHVYRADKSVAVLTETDTLSGEDIIPGFSCPVMELFPAS